MPRGVKLTKMWMRLTKLNAGNSTPIWVNLAMVAGLEQKAERRTLVYFGAGHVAVAETPEEILGVSLPNEWGDTALPSGMNAHHSTLGDNHVHLGSDDPQECELCNPPKSPENSLP